MKRFPIYYPAGAGFDGVLLRAMHAALVHFLRIFIPAAIALTVSSHSLNWVFDFGLWVYFSSILAIYWCIALLYEWRCRRRRQKRTRGYRRALQKMVLERRQDG